MNLKKNSSKRERIKRKGEIFVSSHIIFAYNHVKFEPNGQWFRNFKIKSINAIDRFPEFGIL